MSTWRLWLRHWQARAEQVRGKRRKGGADASPGACHPKGSKDGPRARKPVILRRAAARAAAAPATSARAHEKRPEPRWRTCCAPSQINYPSHWPERHNRALPGRVPPRKGRPAALGASPFRGEARGAARGGRLIPKKNAPVPLFLWFLG